MISIIIISKNEGNMLQQTVDTMLKAKSSRAFEIIVVDDDSQDLSCEFAKEQEYLNRVKLVRKSGPGIAAARNTGVASAIGDVLVFCDAHVMVEDFWLDTMAQAMEDAHAQAACPVICDLDAVFLPEGYIDVMFAAASTPKAWSGCGKTFHSLTETGYLAVPFGVGDVPVMTGPCTMIKRDTFDDLGGFGSAFVGYGWEEEELSLKLWTFGYRMIGVPGTRVQHWFRSIPPYQIHSQELIHNLIVMGFCHYGEKRLKRLMAQLDVFPEAEGYLEQIAQEPVCQQLKAKITLERKHDDSWYMNRFNLPF